MSFLKLRGHLSQGAIQLAALAVLFLCLSPLIHAQSAGTASIQGTVADATGAVITGAAVTLTDNATGVQRSAVTDSSGLYTFPNVPIGTYSISAGMQGFQTYKQTNIVLEVGSSIAINVKMTVGRTTESVEVKANGLALQTEDPTFKQTIDNKAMTEMPLNGRQMTGLIFLSGGSNTAPAGDFTGSKYSYQTISVSVAGGMGNTTMWRLDGGDNNDYMANGNLPFPFPDAVSQFSVEAAGLGAQDSMHTGGMVNVVTQSGTNQYHGSAFEFIRNNYIDATNFFSTCTPVAPATTCSAKDTLHQNQYGGTFGGPILKDKLFAFAAYQRTTADQSQSATKAIIPTTANVNGDWSTTDPVATTANPAGTKTPSGSCNTVYTQLVDPLTGAALPGNKYASTPAYNAQAQALYKYLPQSTRPMTQETAETSPTPSRLKPPTTSSSPASTTPSTRRTTSTAVTSSTAIRPRPSSLPPTSSSPPSPVTPSASKPSPWARLTPSTAPP